MRRILIFIILLCIINIVPLFCREYSSIFIFLDIIFIFLFYKKSKDLRFLIFTLLLIYLLSIFYFMIYNPNFNRSIVIGDSYFKNIFNYLKSNFNIIPFKTIINFLSCLKVFKEFPSVNDIYLNIIGNTICLIPLVFFIMYYKKCSIKKMSFYLLISTFLIEFIQLFTLSGSFDIDDIILNFGGSFLFFLIFKNELDEFIQFKFHFNKINKEKIIKIVIAIIFVIIILISYIFYKVREKEYWNNYYYFKIKILNEKSCPDSIKYTIYEDELYIYQAECEKILDSDIIINKNKYKLSDYINNKTIYPISISKLEDSGLKLSKKEKWNKIILCPYSNNAITYDSENKKIINLVPAEDIIVNNKQCNAFFLVPSSSGNTYVTLNNDTGTKVYKINVDKNLNVIYNEIT